MDVLARLLNALLMLALPLGLGVLLARRLDQRWGLFGAGMLTFAASQVLHLPFNALILSPRLRLDPNAPTGSLLLAAAALGLSAGLFEELARFGALRFWLRQARSWGEALMFGAGHGGIEAFLLGILVLVGFFQALAYRGAELESLVPPEQLAAARLQLEAYWSLPWPQALLGALERLLALCVHLALSVMVMRSLTHRRAWLVAAIGWHALVDAAAVASLRWLGAVGTELVVALLALVSLAIVYRLREIPRTAGGPVPEASVHRPEVVQPISDVARPSKERVEDSRYLQS